MWRSPHAVVMEEKACSPPRLPTVVLAERSSVVEQAPLSTRPVLLGMLLQKSLWRQDLRLLKSLSKMARYLHKTYKSFPALLAVSRLPAASHMTATYCSLGNNDTSFSSNNNNKTTAGLTPTADTREKPKPCETVGRSCGRHLTHHPISTDSVQGSMCNN